VLENLNGCRIQILAIDGDVSLFDQSDMTINNHAETLIGAPVVTTYSDGSFALAITDSTLEENFNSFLIRIYNEDKTSSLMFNDIAVNENTVINGFNYDVDSGSVFYVDIFGYDSGNQQYIIYSGWLYVHAYGA
jgi:hypothetical protein